MTEPAAFDIAFIGHYTQDTIVYPHSSRTVDGGGYFFGAAVAARMGLRAAVVTRLARENWDAVAKMESMGVTMLAHATPASTRLRLIYPTDNLDERTIEMYSWAGPFSAQDVEPVQARAYAIAASSVRGEVPLEVVEALAARNAIVSLDVQGFIRVVRDGKLALDDWPGKEAVLRHVTVLKTDAVEARLLTGLSERCAAARRLAEYGPREVLVTSSSSVLLYHDGVCDEAPLVPRELRGRSGRGDTCTGSYLARRLSASPVEALTWAAAVTSLKLEQEGPFNRDLSEVQALYDRLSSWHS